MHDMTPIMPDGLIDFDDGLILADDELLVLCQQRPMMGGGGIVEALVAVATISATVGQVATVVAVVGATLGAVGAITKNPVLSKIGLGLGVAGGLTGIAASNGLFDAGAVQAVNASGQAGAIPQEAPLVNNAASQAPISVVGQSTATPNLGTTNLGAGPTPPQTPAGDITTAGGPNVSGGNVTNLADAATPPAGAGTASQIANAPPVGSGTLTPAEPALGQGTAIDTATTTAPETPTATNAPGGASAADSGAAAQTPQAPGTPPNPNNAFEPVSNVPGSSLNVNQNYLYHQYMAAPDPKGFLAGLSSSDKIVLGSGLAQVIGGGMSTIAQGSREDARIRLAQQQLGLTQQQVQSLLASKGSAGGVINFGTTPSGPAGRI